MKKVILFVFSLLTLSIAGFADTLILENQTAYPKKNTSSKMAIQWANSAKDIEEGNRAILQGSNLSPNDFQAIAQTGKVNVTIPNKAEYFRVLVWSKGDGSPDLHTNWVDITPGRIYILKKDHLVPSVLAAGTGC